MEQVKIFSGSVNTNEFKAAVEKRINDWLEESAGKQKKRTVTRVLQSGEASNFVIILFYEESPSEGPYRNPA